jgi:ubiquinone biosynthesis protein UbiJ
MNAPNTVLQAALRRLSARLGSGLADAAASLATLAQEAPERLQQELSLFWQEVQQEADRLERGQRAAGGEAGAGTAAAGPVRRDAPSPGHGAFGSTQDQIDHLRARVAQLSRRLEDLG